MKILLINSKVWLGNNSFADSIGFDPGTGMIEFVGFESKADKREFTEIIDCGGKLVLPSFMDGHLHFIKGSLVSMHLDLRNASVKNDFINGIGLYIKINKPSREGEWIQGGYFSDSNFKEEIRLGKEFLDEINSEIPMLISRFDNHSGFVNTKAIELTGISSFQDRFGNDELIKNEKGELTGEVKESAREFVLSNIPKLPVDKIAGTAFERMKKFHQYGITSISDITLPEDLIVYSELLSNGKLDLFVNSQLPFVSFNEIEDFKKTFGKYNNFKLNCFKAFYDGSLSSKTALFHSDYKNISHSGMKTAFVESGDFFKLGFEIDKAGYQMCVHAIGDKAVTDLLEFAGELNLINGIRDRRFRIEHAQHIREMDIEKFKQLDVIASVQSSHLFSDAKTAVEELNDYTTTHNYKKLIDYGAIVAFGTDFPIVSENPFETIYYAMTRKTDTFGSFLPGLKINLADCLRSYTFNNAYASFGEKTRGILKEGYAADITVTDDLFTMSDDEIKDGKAYMTFYGGKRVF
jgi:predicted amidohydrolase YtcJ